jgi:hypothetical protein
MKITAIYVLVVLFLLGECAAQKGTVKEENTVHDIEKISIEESPELTTEEARGEAQALLETAEERETEKAYDEIIYERRETVSIIQVIESLEESYEKNDFELWKSFLTPKYREKYNDPEILKKEGWNVGDLESFFKLLIDTRKKGKIAALEISRVEFINPNKALVYVVFGGEEFPEPQHTFIKINDKWYKGLIEEGE